MTNVITCVNINSGLHTYIGPMHRMQGLSHRMQAGHVAALSMLHTPQASQAASPISCSLVHVYGDVEGLEGVEGLWSRLVKSTVY